MKSSTKILSLSVATVAILVFWLLPKMNQASDRNYVRVIEDTESDPKVIVTPVVNPKSGVNHSENKSENKKENEASGEVKNEKKVKTEGKEDRKKYKKEVIKPDYTLKDIDPSMYSRAIHFIPEEEFMTQDTIAVDTIASVQ